MAEIVVLRGVQRGVRFQWAVGQPKPCGMAAQAGTCQQTAVRQRPGSRFTPRVPRTVGIWIRD